MRNVRYVPLILFAFALGAVLSLGEVVYAADHVVVRNGNDGIIVHANDGSYEIVDENHQISVIHAKVGASIDHHWVTSSDYPRHEINDSEFTGTLGHGRQISVKCTGLREQPDLVYLIRLYDSLPAGDIEVELQNHTAKPVTVQTLRPVESMGDRAIHTGASESSDRVLSDSFSEDWPPLRIYDLGQAPNGALRAVGSQLIYNRQSRESLFFGALSADRFLTIMHLKANPQAPNSDEITSYTVDSTGTTEIQASDPESGLNLKRSPAKNLIELSIRVEAGATVSSEPLLFSVGDNYYSILDNYGSAIRTLHHPRISSDSILGWWSWTAFYSGITEGNTWTNAQWLAEHLKHFGYDYFHLDLGYAYARGEYATPNAAQFPSGLAPLTGRVCKLGLKMGFWTAPFEVSDRSWIYEHHQDWLVHNAQGEPINIGVGEEAGKELLFVLDTTNPDAQEYLRSTYRTLAREWGAQYIKLDFMDNTAIEGYYYRPQTTALEAQRIGLEIIRKAVGEHVRLDKDGSPMLTPVGLVDEGRLSQDTGHTFLRSKQAAPGIAARYYMQHNFFLSDPDAFTISRQMIEERRMQASLTLSEAQASITLAAVSGGMFEIGDDLPTLGSDPERLSLLTNHDLLQMVKLGRAALPLDLMTYSSEDGQPSVFLLHVDQRQAMLAEFNWTEKPRSHVFSLPELALSPHDSYRLTDVFQPEDQLSVNDGTIKVDHLAAHSVRLIKIIDESIPAAPPSISVTVPQVGAVGEDLGFAGIVTTESIPALGYHWDFGDGVVTDGATATHTYTHAGTFKAHLTVEGVDGVFYQHIFPVAITGKAALPAPRRYVVENP